jgi:RHS repeat-associated protein
MDGKTRLLLMIFASTVPATVLADRVTYIYTDPLGTPVLDVDVQGRVINSYEYGPYGRPLLGRVPSGPGYTSHVTDATTGLLYMQARYLDPELGVFYSRDPDRFQAGNIFTLNDYMYANGNPIKNVDPDGRACKEATEKTRAGCWVTDEERRYANKGDWKSYYATAAKGGDQYAKRAGEVANNTGSGFLGFLTLITNFRLETSIAVNVPNIPMKTDIIKSSMENIHVQLVQEHVAALDRHGASPSNPVQLKRSEIVEFHEVVFIHNFGGKVFGGKTWDHGGEFTRAVYDWCPSPSCEK